jgi:hypothetical protein
MRNLLLATAAGFALVLTVAPSFAATAAPAPAAAQQEQNANGSIESQCAAILADKAGHSEADVKFCASKQ